jgi:hypothetical protein
MTYRKPKLVHISVGVFVALLMAATPATSRAAGIAFTNKLDGPIVVQGASFVGGVWVRGQALLIQPGKAGVDPSLVQGFRQIVIYDANKPNVQLMKKIIQFPGVDVHYHVGPNLNPPSPQHPWKVDLYLQKKQ